MRQDSPDPSADSRGQVLVIFVLIVVAMMGMLALALDVGGVYAAERNYQSVADAAALAGAQNLSSRSVSSADQTSARTAAESIIVNRLGGSITCATHSGSLSGVTYTTDTCSVGASYIATVTTPSPNCVNCDSTNKHSIQVTVDEPAHPTTMAALFGQSSWNVKRTSVAGITLNPTYALMALRPSPGAVSDVNVGCSGFSTCTLNVAVGDLGSNTFATITTGATSNIIILGAGYNFVHSSNMAPPPANITAGQSKLNPGLILDPNYTMASFSSAPQYATLAAAEVLPTKQPPPATNTPTDCPTSINAGTFMPTLCLQPGAYNFAVTVPSGQTYYLLSGTYEFNLGLTVTGTLVGGAGSALSGPGLLPDPNGHTGVVLVVPKNQTLSMNGTVSLNWIAGCTSVNTSTCLSTPANDIFGSGAPLVTPSPQSFPLTIEVPKDGNCFGGPNGTTPINSGLCQLDSGSNKSILLGSGNGVHVQIGGVVYAPSNGFTASGNFLSIFGSVPAQIVGQLVVWTTTQNSGLLGSSELTVEYPLPAPTQVGIVSLDAGCSPGTACISPP